MNDEDDRGEDEEETGVDGCENQESKEKSKASSSPSSSFSSSSSSSTSVLQEAVGALWTLCGDSPSPPSLVPWAGRARIVNGESLQVIFDVLWPLAAIAGDEEGGEEGDEEGDEEGEAPTGIVGRNNREYSTGSKKGGKKRGRTNTPCVAVQVLNTMNTLLERGGAAATSALCIAGGVGWGIRALTMLFNEGCPCARPQRAATGRRRGGGGHRRNGGGGGEGGGGGREAEGQSHMVLESPLFAPLLRYIEVR